MLVYLVLTFNLDMLYTVESMVQATYVPSLIEAHAVLSC